jgi:hypothetical protein
MKRLRVYSTADGESRFDRVEIPTSSRGYGAVQHCHCNSERRLLLGDYFCDSEPGRKLAHEPVGSNYLEVVNVALNAEISEIWFSNRKSTLR